MVNRRSQYCLTIMDLPFLTSRVVCLSILCKGLSMKLQKSGSFFHHPDLGSGPEWTGHPVKNKVNEKMELLGKESYFFLLSF